MMFEELGVPNPFIVALGKQLITVPTPIQVAAIPQLLKGQSLYLHAETGSGKTIAYLLPLLTSINTELPNTQGVIIAPTYELAIQIQRQCTDLAQNSGVPVRVLLLIGGTARDRQLEKLKKKPHIIVGSPGRIAELIEARKVKLNLLKTIIIDEADKLISEESLGEVRAILRAAPRDKQVVFASATPSAAYADTIEALAPGTTTIQTNATPINPNIDHWFTVCEERDKADLVRKLLRALNPERAMVFVHRNEDAEIVASKLLHHKLAAADLHGAFRKEDRKQALEGFRKGSTPILIASDLAARGLDIRGVTLIVNLDMPSESRAYLHRVGRTARAGATGVAISVVTEQQRRLISRIERELGVTFTEGVLRGGEFRAVNEA
jgi:superfamily II DNA/RNA helicase